MYSFILHPSAFILFFAAFPRGPGFYFHLGKLLSGAVVYLVWVRACWWVDRDAKRLKLPAPTWNLLMLLAGVVGMFALWTFPWGIGLPLLLVLSWGAALGYVVVRNEAVPVDQRVLTPRHLRELAGRWVRLSREPKAPATEEGKQPRKRAIPLRFIGKSVGGRAEDPNRVRRAEESRGYQKALEMVQDALDARASDIHLEPTRDEMFLRFRIDGVLETAGTWGRALGDSILNIFKVLADLDITEKRKPQDGSFGAVAGAGPSGGAGERELDFRVSTAGSVVGEKMVLRILDRSRQVSNLSQVGMRGKLREQVHAIVTQPHGMFIVCGPTGAGKSTTLAAALSEIDRYQKNVITLENPVEYTIANVTQIEINPKAGKTFATELRSILRQDPDVIYLGEVRDQETAEIACQAAQTGHMVFTTLHANDAVTALGRLLDLGVPPFLIASAVSAVLGQRLVRILCPRCKERYKPNADLLRKANLPADRIKYFYRPPEGAGEGKHSCKHCNGSGYRGRTGIFELLVITDPIRGLIRENPDLDAIRREAVKAGMTYLQEDGLRQVIDGETAIQELLRVCK
jgi:type II secretory ATPase GspE/PulE/Tfp pilus assembly ATPase PilB-like protein